MKAKDFNLDDFISSTNAKLAKQRYKTPQKRFNVKEKLEILEANGFDPSSFTVQQTVREVHKAKPISVANRINCFASDKLKQASYRREFNNSNLNYTSTNTDLNDGPLPT